MHRAETSKFTFLLLYCELSIDHKVKPCALNVCSAGEIFTPYSSCFKAIDQILFAWHFLDSMWIKWLFRDGCLQPLLIKECSPARRHLQTLLWHTWGESHALSTLQPHYSGSGRLLVGRAGPSFHIATAASLTMPTGTIENKLKTGQAAESHILLTWDCKNDKLYIRCCFHSTNNVINLLQYSTDHLVSISQRQNCVFHHPSPSFILGVHAWLEAWGYLCGCQEGVSEFPSPRSLEEGLTINMIVFSKLCYLLRSHHRLAFLTSPKSDL